MNKILLLLITGAINVAFCSDCEKEEPKPCLLFGVGGVTTLRHYEEAFVGLAKSELDRDSERQRIASQEEDIKKTLEQEKQDLHTYYLASITKGNSSLLDYINVKNAFLASLSAAVTLGICLGCKNIRKLK